MGNAGASFKHNFREQETLNANPELTPNNEHLLAENRSEAMGNLRNKLPEKRRKDAVVAVEYMMTASPEYFESATDEQQQEFFKQSLDWLKNKYGADNVIAASIHRDERTPHMAAYVVPLTSDGRLSAKEFIGNRQTMKNDQTSFAKAVEHLGLQRGVEGSKAKHQTIQSFYSKLNTTIKPINITEDAVKPRKTFLGLGGESHSDVAERLSKSLTRSIQPVMAKALAYDELLKSKELLKNSLSELRENNDRSTKEYREELKNMTGVSNIPDEIKGEVGNAVRESLTDLYAGLYDKYQMDYRFLFRNASNPEERADALKDFEEEKRDFARDNPGQAFPSRREKSYCAKFVVSGLSGSYFGNTEIKSVISASGTYPAPKDTPEEVLMRNPHHIKMRENEAQARKERQKSISKSQSSGGFKI